MFIDIAKYNGMITVRNPKTGEHRTFRIRFEEWCGKRVLGLLIGPENTNDYLNFGFVNDTGFISVWSKYREGEHGKFARILMDQAYFMEEHSLEYSQTISCRKCNRPLTDPVSIELGIGPKCRGEV